MCNVVNCIGDTIANANGTEWITAIATCVAAVVAVGTLIVAYMQLKRINSTDSSRFLLELRDAFSEEKRWEVHRAIKDSSNGYLENHDIEVDDYLGLFEICEIMINKGTMTVEDFKNFYFYRLEYILDNSFILEKLLTEKAFYWANFSRLFKRFPELKEDYYKTPEQILFWEKVENEW